MKTTRKSKAPTQSAGEIMVASIIEEMREEGVMPNSKETQLLATARQLVDHLAALEVLIVRDGEMPLVAGVAKLHPALSEHRQIAVSLTKVLQGIVIGDTQSGTAKNPSKVRAAQVRWAAVAKLKDAQAVRAGL